MTMVDQKSAFAERINRINSGRQYEHQDVVGYRTQKLYDMKFGARDKRPKRTFVDYLMIPIAFFSGTIAMLLGRVIYFHLSQLDGMPEAFVSLGAKGMLLSTLIIAGFLTALLHLSTKGRMPALLLGCAVMHFGEPGMAATAPALWAEFYSPDYVAEVAGGSALAGLTAG
jgi:hypothetical protein